MEWGTLFLEYLKKKKAAKLPNVPEIKQMQQMVPKRMSKLGLRVSLKPWMSVVADGVKLVVDIIAFECPEKIDLL